MAAQPAYAALEVRARPSVGGIAALVEVCNWVGHAGAAGLVQAWAFALLPVPLSSPYAGRCRSRW
jgi:hypothetical protein